MDSGYLDPSVEEQPSRGRRVLESLGPHYGQILISCAILLVAFGTVMVFSASFYQHGVDGDVFFFMSDVSCYGFRLLCSPVWWPTTLTIAFWRVRIRGFFSLP